MTLDRDTFQNDNNGNIILFGTPVNPKNSVDQYAIMKLVEGIKQQMTDMLSILTKKTNFENSISGLIDVSEGETDMAKKIRRPIMINGVKHWICGDSEQEYADNVIRIAMGDVPVALPAESKKHNFREYAQNWFEVFSKPCVVVVTAFTYERQL